MNFTYCDTPIGRLRLVSNGQKLCAIEFDGQHGGDGSPAEHDDPLLLEAGRQLGEYFDGSRREFDLPLGPAGTDFQQSVWRSLQTIPYGVTRSYAQIARSIGRDKAVRAVGAANGRNPLPIVVPCHRVIGSDGTLTGFAGGMEAKRWLLQLEGALQAVIRRRDRGSCRP